MRKQEEEQLILFPAVSRANRIALSEKDLPKMTKDTYGQSFLGLSEKSSRRMLLEKMLMGYYLQYISPYSPTWKNKIKKYRRTVYRLAVSERTMKDTGFVFLASPRASQDFKPIRKQTPKEHSGKHGQTLCSSIGIICPERIGQYINPQFTEWMMGFPIGWGDIINTSKE